MREIAQRQIVIIAHDIRSTHNIGSLLRTAEGLGVDHVYISGISPFPSRENDERLPHIHQKLTRQIQKTALGAEESQAWSHAENIELLLSDLKKSGYRIVGLEQSKSATRLPEYVPPEKVAVLLGREVEGLSQELISVCDDLVEIPMFGQKESFNVVQAAAMTLYHLRFN